MAARNEFAEFQALRVEFFIEVWRCEPRKRAEMEFSALASEISGRRFDRKYRESK